MAHRASPGDLSVQALVQEHHALVYRVCFSVVGNAADAEDATQQTFLKLLRQPEKFHQADSPRAYLAAAAVNGARQLIRSEQARRQREQSWAQRQEAATGSEEAAMDMRDMMEEAIAELPEDLRVPTVLYYQGGLKYREIGSALSWPDGTVARRIANAKERLRGWLQQRGATVASVAAVEPFLLQLPPIEVPSHLEQGLLELLASETTGLSTAAAASASSKSALLSGALLLAGALVISTVWWGPWRGPAAERAGSGMSASPELARADTGANEPTVAAAPPTANASESSSSAVADTTDADDRTSLADSNRGGRVYGVVTTSEGRPLAGAEVSVATVGFESVPTATTISDAQGRYELYPLASVEFAEDEEADASLSQRDDGRSQKWTPTNEPVQTERVQRVVSQAQMDTPQQVAYVRDPGAFTVRARHAGYQVSEATFFGFDEGSEKKLDLQLAQGMILRGRVLSRTGEPLAAAEVLVVGAARIADRDAWGHLRTGDRSALTDDSGWFEFGSLPAADYVVRIAAAGHAARELLLSKDRENHPQLQLDPGGNVSVKVVGPEGAPVPGVTVKLFHKKVLQQEGVVDSSGGWQAHDLAAGDYEAQLFLHSRGLPMAVERFRVQPSTTAAVQLQCAQPSQLAGRLQIPEHMEDFYFDVALFRLQSGGTIPQRRHTVFVDRQLESFQMGDLPPGRYQWLLRGGRGKGYRRNILAVGETELAPGSCELVLSPQERSAQLDVSIRDSHGRPIEAEVTLRQDPSDYEIEDASTDEDGTTSLAVLPGRYQVSVTAPGYRATTRSLAFADGEARELKLSLEPLEAGEGFELSSAFEQQRLIFVQDDITYAQLLALIDVSMEEYSLRADAELATSGVLHARRVQGRLMLDAPVMLVTLFGSGGFQLEHRGDEIVVTAADE